MSRMASHARESRCASCAVAVRRAQASSLGAIAAPLSYRVVEKSLPSLDLLSYVSKRAATDRFLVLHLPFLSALVGALPDAEVLVGKAHLTSAVRSFFNAQPAGTDLAALSARLAFIADSQERLTELEALAKSLGITLRIVVEIDVGLRRSGLSDQGVDRLRDQPHPGAPASG